MSRFAFKNYRNVAKIYNCCRLCGIDNPGKMPILGDDDLEIICLDEEEEEPLNKKIELCVGIRVYREDHLPQYCCQMCHDKINDFYEFRLMCASTDHQTRRLLGLPMEPPAQMVVERKVPEVKPETAAAPSPAPGPQDRRGPKSRRGKEDLSGLLPKKEEPKESLLEEKAPNERELLHDRPGPKSKKRKAFEPPVMPMPVLAIKKLKSENAAGYCMICDKEFDSADDLYAHQFVRHVPKTSKYGCSSCAFAMETPEQWNEHKTWHSKSKKPYHCPRCNYKSNSFISYSKHINVNDCKVRGRALVKTQPDIECRKCKKKYLTQSLYEWHLCFIRTNGNCRKCGRHFLKKQKLFQHYLACTAGVFKDFEPEPPVVLAPPELVPSTKGPRKGTGGKQAKRGAVTFGKPSTSAATAPPVVKSEQDQDLTELLETNIAEVSAREDGLEQISTLLNSVNSAIAKMSNSKKKKKEKKKGKKTDRKLLPFKLNIKHEPAVENAGDDESGESVRPEANGENAEETMSSEPPQTEPTPINEESSEVPVQEGETEEAVADETVAEEAVAEEAVAENVETEEAVADDAEAEEAEEDLAYVPQEEHFADLANSDDENDDQAEQQGANETPQTGDDEVVASAPIPPIRIKQEKLHPGYGDFDPEVARNIKKEPNVEVPPPALPSEVCVAMTLPRLKATAKPRPNPLAKRAKLMLKIKKERGEGAKKTPPKKKAAPNPAALRAKLMLKIKKERGEAGQKQLELAATTPTPTPTPDAAPEEDETPEPLPPPVDETPSIPNESIPQDDSNSGGDVVEPQEESTEEAPPAVPEKAPKLLKIPRALALKIKKEKADKAATKARSAQILRIKRERTDEEHGADDEETVPDTDYLGLNPLSLFRKKKRVAKPAAVQMPVIASVASEALQLPVISAVVSGETAAMENGAVEENRTKSTSPEEENSESPESRMEAEAEDQGPEVDQNAEASPEEKVDEPETMEGIPEVTEPETMEEIPEVTEPETMEGTPKVTEPEKMEGIPEEKVDESETMEGIPEVTEPQESCTERPEESEVMEGHSEVVEPQGTSTEEQEPPIVAPEEKVAESEVMEGQPEVTDLQNPTLDEPEPSTLPPAEQVPEMEPISVEASTQIIPSEPEKETSLGELPQSQESTPQELQPLEEPEKVAEKEPSPPPANTIDHPASEPLQSQETAPQELQPLENLQTPEDDEMETDLMPDDFMPITQAPTQITPQPPAEESQRDTTPPDPAPAPVPAPTTTTTMTEFDLEDLLLKDDDDDQPMPWTDTSAAVTANTSAIGATTATLEDDEELLRAIDRELDEEPSLQQADDVKGGTLDV